MKIPSASTKILLSVLAAFAVAASACGVTRGGGSSADPAATIEFGESDSIKIAFSEVNQIVGSIESSSGFVDTFYQGEVVADLDTQILNMLIVDSAIERALTEDGLTVDQEAIESERAGLEAQISGRVGNPDEANEVISEIDSYISALSRINARQLAMADVLVAAAPVASVETVPCTRHILVETLAEADDLAAQLNEGADFGELAVEFSLDPGSGQAGGSLGCGSPDQFVPPFRDAILAGAEGELLGPVKTQHGHHLIVIEGYDEFQAPPPNGVELVLERISSILGSATTIEIDETFGTWDTAGLIVIPNAG